MSGRYPVDLEAARQQPGRPTQTHLATAPVLLVLLLDSRRRRRPRPAAAVRRRVDLPVRPQHPAGRSGRRLRGPPVHAAGPPGAGPAGTAGHPRPLPARHDDAVGPTQAGDHPAAPGSGGELHHGRLVRRPGPRPPGLRPTAQDASPPTPGRVA
jgi:hypothetical protein